CCGELVVAFALSPKSHSYDGAVAPFTPVTVKTNSFGRMEPPTTRGSTVKSKTQSATTWLSSRTLTVAVYVIGVVPSVTVSLTSYLPAEAYLCVTFAPARRALARSEEHW